MVRFFDEDEVPKIYNLADIPTSGTEENLRRTFRGNDKLISIADLGPGISEEQHEHPWEQIVFVLDGVATFYAGEDEFEIETHDIFVVPPCVPHYVETVDSSCTLLTVHPLREDRLEHTRYQTEFE